MTYQWLKDGSPISGATDNSYTISSALARDNGLYSVAVGSPCGSVTSESAALAFRADLPLTISSSAFRRTEASF
jgi:hypothetical protein